MKKGNKLVAGIGTNDLKDIEKQFEMGLTPVLQGKCYKAWKNRLEAETVGKRATVCIEWQTYSNFARWWLETHIEGWYIDKDWIVAGNKEYHPDKCVWIPNKINTLMNDRSTNCLPKGVSIQQQKYKDAVYKYYQATCRVNGVRKGTTLSTAIDAHRQWQLWKIQEINNVLREFAFDQRLDGRVIQRLIEVRDNIQSDYDNNIETK
ncbi:hypothetical protein [Serratia marcescens]|uniref:hypothetical protein n=1 Tax=Serratia marcescens TaxID=615 RepID=UPI0013DC0F38|nr:hypothetical protein [Serratia marcescens]EHT9936730.1 hypothetical protein [Serratia marcescens]EIJ6676535.1 hypothetical protein [Serratia marcescens]MDP8601226.1 hypothetical protein [Serratia marcescens]MDP8685926.1 hypothetical protein [Serratia marcescens]MDP8794824.1 hypothetical protein [Serratia marcescens]